MIFYRFHELGGRAIAITDDITGAKLPKVPGAWKADGQTDVSEGGRMRLGHRPEEIIATIGRDGFFLGTLPG